MSHPPNHHTKEGITERDLKPEGFSNPPASLPAPYNHLHNKYLSLIKNTLGTLIKYYQNYDNFLFRNILCVNNPKKFV